jgi:hypothetical protein
MIREENWAYAASQLVRCKMYSITKYHISGLGQSPASIAIARFHSKNKNVIDYKRTPILLAKLCFRISALGIALYAFYAITTKFVKLPVRLGDLGEFLLVFISVGFFVTALLLNEKPGDEQD